MVQEYVREKEVEGCSEGLFDPADGCSIESSITGDAL